jgi:hypothetical protein
VSSLLVSLSLCPNNRSLTGVLCGRRPGSLWLPGLWLASVLLLLARRSYLNSAEIVLLASVFTVQGVVVPVQVPALPPETLQPPNE